MTRIQSALALCIAALCASGPISAIADECSGGPHGGMGASGNECSNPEPELLLVPEAMHSTTAPAQGVPTGNAMAKPAGHAKRNGAGHANAASTRHKTHTAAALHPVGAETVSR